MRQPGSTMSDWLRSKWTVPVLSLAVGLVMLAAAAAGGKPQLGAEMFGVMAVFAVAVLVAGDRSETVRGLRGDGRDERFEMLDLRATAIAGFAGTLAIIGGFVYELAHGRSGMPYTWLGALVGVAYIIAVVVLRLRV